MHKYKPMLKLMVRRRIAGFTHRELAERLGVKAMAISAYERGERFPRRDLLDKLAEALNCEVKDLI